MKNENLKILFNKSTFGWALYDWANSSFATTVMAGFFPLFFKQYWSYGSPSTTSTFYLGLANSVAGFLLAVISPMLGCVADQGGYRKHFLAGFALLGILSTACLAQAGLGEWIFAAWLYVIALIGFAGSSVFYDALIVEVSEKKHLDLVSGFGYGLGYLGGGVLFTLNVLMYLNPHWFGLADGTSGIKASFVLVSLWWLLFSIPLFVWVSDPLRTPALPFSVALKKGWQTFLLAFQQLKGQKNLTYFLLSYLFYIEGVNTVIKMAVDYGMALGFPSSSLIAALLIVQFVGFPAAIAFGYFGEKFGPRKSIWVCILVYGAVTIYAHNMDQVYEFYVMAICVGLVQGGIQALSRSLFGRLVPKEQAAEYFGFFNMFGKFSAIIGPLLVGLTAALTHNSRSGILVILLFFALGGVLLIRVNVNGLMKER